MRRTLEDFARKMLKRFDIAITSQKNFQRLCDDLNQLTEQSNTTSHDIELILELPDQQCSRLLKALRNSKSQLGQDLFVLSELDFKRGGFFVEFGATNGVDLSNTCLLEREFGWSGILAEPAKRWHGELRKNRTSCIETDCVWSVSDSVLSFNEVDTGELSTIASYSSSDVHSEARTHGKTYAVKTISLEDLLDKHDAPKQIDYLSIDTEGSEFEILSNFDFTRYEFRVITCEHNSTPARESICSLLTQNGYVRKLTKFSKFDDWYVKVN
jgi:FkbM family methyltransferase